MIVAQGGIGVLGGRTPLVEFDRLSGCSGARVFGKLEAFNPSGSAKDRTARYVLESALLKGEIQAGDHVIESSSGNFGVALAQQCRLHRLDFTCVIDPRTNRMTRQLIEAYGGRLHYVRQPDPQTGDWLAARIAAVADLQRRERSAGRRAWSPRQYSNPDNPRAHAETTMREIAEAMDPKPDVVVIATSTTGTLGGCMQYARQYLPETRFVAVDAVGSVLFGGVRGTRRLPGFGAGVLPAVAEHVRPHEIVRVSDLDCVIGCRVLAKTEAYLAGASGGGAITALLSLGLSPGTTACVLLHDGGERYLDTVYDDQWVHRELDCDPTTLARLVEQRIAMAG